MSNSSLLPSILYWSPTSSITTSGAIWRRATSNFVLGHMTYSFSLACAIALSENVWAFSPLHTGHSACFLTSGEPSGSNLPAEMSRKIFHYKHVSIAILPNNSKEFRFIKSTVITTKIWNKVSSRGVSMNSRSLKRDDDKCSRKGNWLELFSCSFTQAKKDLDHCSV